MIDALKQLFENNVLSEDIRAQIEEAWNAKVKENKQHAVAELREEFAEKYEHDKQSMIEAVDAMLSERLAEEIKEFAEDRNQLAEAKTRYAQAMRENSELLRGFVVEQLQTEIEELHNERAQQEQKLAKLEEFVVEALSGEIAEFYEDKKDLAETKVRLVSEAKQHFKRVKENFVKKGAQAVAETVDSQLGHEIKQLKEDIDTARQNDFGRKIFEAVAAEYSMSYLNEKSEIAKLMKVLETKDKQLDEARAFAGRAKQLVESAQKDKKRLVESTRRQKIISDLVGPLGKDQREIMMDLLESVQTDRLQTQFNKYLPAVIEGKPAEQKSVLTENTREVTGNTITESKNDTQDDNVFDIRRLAGLK